MEKISRYDVADHNSNLFPMLEGEFCYFEDHEQAIQKERQGMIKFLEDIRTLINLVGEEKKCMNNITAEISRLKALK